MASSSSAFGLAASVWVGVLLSRTLGAAVLVGETLGETVGCLVGLGCKIFVTSKENLESATGESAAVPVEVVGPLGGRLDGIPVGEVLGDGLGWLLVGPELVPTVAAGPALGVAVGEWLG